jgi:hypothetical protein
MQGAAQAGAGEGHCRGGGEPLPTLTHGGGRGPRREGVALEGSGARQVAGGVNRSERPASLSRRHRLSCCSLFRATCS